MIKEGQAIPEISSIIEKLSFDNIGFTEAISRNLLRIMNDSMERLHEAVHIVSCLERVLLIKDSLWKQKA